MKKCGIALLLVALSVIHGYSLDLTDLQDFLVDRGRMFGASNAGLTAFPILQVPMGGEYEAMGTAYTAVGRDASFIESNPASTSILSSTEISVTHNNLIADVSMEGLIYTVRFGDLGLGIAGKFVHVDFTSYDSFGTQLSSTIYSESVAGLNLSYNFFPSFYFHGIAVGANLKMAGRQVAQETAPGLSAVGVMIDVGALTRINFLKHYASRDRNLSFGILAQNIGPPAAEDPLPTSLKAGLAYAPIRPLTVSADLIYPISFSKDVSADVMGIAFGASLTVTDFFSTHAGLLIRGDNPRLTVGADMDLSDLTLSVNYTLDMTTQVGRLDRFSLQARMSLGDGGRGNYRATVEEYYLDSLLALAAGDVERTIELTKKALEMDPRFQPARETLNTAVRTLDLQQQMNAIRLGEQIPELNVDELPAGDLSDLQSQQQEIGDSTPAESR